MNFLPENKFIGPYDYGFSGPLRYTFINKIGRPCEGIPADGRAPPIRHSIGRAAQFRRAFGRRGIGFGDVGFGDIRFGRFRFGRLDPWLGLDRL